MPATSKEAWHIDSEGPTEVQLTYINDGAAKSITNHEIFGKATDASKLIAAIVAASTEVATIGILANGETGQIWIEGRFRVPKDTDVPLIQGHSAYWDISTNKATTNAVADQSGDFCLGIVVKSISTAGKWVEIDLNTGPNKYDIGT